MDRSPPKAAELTRGGDGAGSFSDLLADVRVHVDRRLAALWDQKLAELTKRGPDVQATAAAARDLTLRGGKRFRAALLVAAYTGVAPSAPREPALEAGAALELVQSYLLIQDDWMDGDATRRGGPSVHAALSEVFGRPELGAWCAILASDLTWGLALSTLVSLGPLGVPADRVLDVLRRFGRMHDDVVVGQCLDVLGRTEDVEVIHTLKTGSYTVRGPLLLGAALAGAREEVFAALDRYAAPLGVAFQLRDDLLGTYGTSEQTGKPYGGDLRAGKRTAVLVEALGRLDAKGKRLVDAVLGNAAAADRSVRAAASAMEACGARAAVEARLRALCDEAERLSRDLPLTEAARDLLRGAVNALRLGGPAAAGAAKSKSKEGTRTRTRGSR